MKLTIHLQLLLRLIILGVLPLCPLHRHIFIGWLYPAMFIGSEVMTYSPHFFSSFIYQYIKLNPCPHETSDMASNKIIIYDTV